MATRKPGLMVGIMVGNKKPGLESPEPVESKGRPKLPAAKPAPPPNEFDIAHEEGEKNLDFDMIGEKFGLSPDESKAFAYDVLEACMNATGGARHEEEEPPEPTENGDGEEV